MTESVNQSSVPRTTNPPLKTKQLTIKDLLSIVEGEWR